MKRTSFTIRARIDDHDRPVVTVRGREAWALLALLAASERGAVSASSGCAV